MSDFCRLHAGGVVRNGAAALLVGPSGAGKSTLVVRMVNDGFGLLSDDEVWLHAESRLAHPTGRSLLLKDSAWDLFPAQRDSFVHTGEEGMPVMVAERRGSCGPGCRACPSPVAAVVLLKPATGDRPLLEEMGRQKRSTPS